MGGSDTQTQKEGSNHKTCARRRMEEEKGELSVSQDIRLNGLSLSLCKCVSLCPSVPLSICDYGSDVSVLLFPNLFSLCLYLCLSLPLYLSLPSSVSLSLSPSLFVSLKSLCMFLCLSLCLPHSLFSSRPSVTLPTFPVHCRENIQQLFFARARSLTAGTNIEKFRINWVLIICQQKKKNLEMHT